jgi:hypothetical protein
VSTPGQVTLKEKPELRKAGRIYYTPRYIVDYVVEQTLGKTLATTPFTELPNLKVLDLACGSGSSLIRAFERICDHYQVYFRGHPKPSRPDLWYQYGNVDVALTTHLKRQILLNNIYDVDLDPQAVEVTVLSLY